MKTVQLHVASQVISGDLDTPVSAYLKLAPVPGVLLESVVGGEAVARHSVIGFDPIVEYVADSNGVAIQTSIQSRYVQGNPVSIIQADFSRYQLVHAIGGFPQGLMGYLSWEIIALIEKVQLQQKPGVGLDLGRFFLPGSMVVFDHATRTILVVGLSSQSESEAINRVEYAISKLASPLSQIARSVIPPSKDVFDHVQSAVGYTQFVDMVNRAKGHIREGDVFQLVVSQRFELESKKHPFDVYRDLRLINPSPYMFFFDFGQGQLIGSSPEILVRLDQGVAHLRPIAGTRPRDHDLDPIKEARLIDDLLADEKEVAEHIMLVDLGRNDLVLVCESVSVSYMLSIEKYSHVMHIVSHVQGKLQSGISAFDLLRATFPAGTVSGAPKVRAISLIDEIEPTQRGVYAGSVGYVDFSGNMDMCIAIRTAICVGGVYYVQAGAGVVADSDPYTEFVETQNKARGILSACYGG